MAPTEHTDPALPLPNGPPSGAHQGSERLEGEDLVRQLINVGFHEATRTRYVLAVAEIWPARKLKVDLADSTPHRRGNEMLQDRDKCKLCRQPIHF